MRSEEPPAGVRTILILGATGEVGLRMARLLLRHSPHRLVLSGRNRAQLGMVAATLDEELPGAAARLGMLVGDPADPAVSGPAIASAAALIVALPGSVPLSPIYDAAVTAGTIALDLFWQEPLLRQIQGYAERAGAGGACLVTQTGFHPGLAEPMTRRLLELAPGARSVRLGLLLRIRQVRAAQLVDLMDAMVHAPLRLHEDGRWRSCHWSETGWFDFGSPFGRQRVVPVYLDELEALPAELGLDALGAWAAGLNPVADWLVLPWLFLLHALRPGLGRSLLARLLAWSLRWFTRGPERAMMVAEAESGGERVRLSVAADDPYELTAVPVVAGLLELLAMAEVPAGVWRLGGLVDSAALLTRMAAMGVDVTPHPAQP